MKAAGAACSRTGAGRTGAAWLLAGLATWVALDAATRSPQPATTAATTAATMAARYLKGEHQVAMRDGVTLFTAVYAPSDTSRTYPIMLLRTPYSVAPVRPVGLPDLARARRRRFSDEGFIFVYQDVRGKFRSGGEFVQVRPYLAEQAARRHRREHRHLRHHRLAAGARARPQRARRHVGHLVSRLLRVDGRDRRAPGAQGGLAAGAGRRLVRRRRLPPQRRVLPGARVPLDHLPRARPARAGAPSCRRGSRFRRPTATPSSSAFPRSVTSTGCCSRAACRSGPRPWSTTPTTVLARARRPAAPEEHHAGLADRRRLVRRGGSVRRARDLPGDRARQPARRQPPGDGPVVSRPMGERRRIVARRRAVRREHGGVLSRTRSSCRSSCST